MNCFSRGKTEGKASCYGVGEKLGDSVRVLKIASERSEAVPERGPRSRGFMVWGLGDVGTRRVPMPEVASGPVRTAPLRRGPRSQQLGLLGR